MITNIDPVLKTIMELSGIKFAVNRGSEVVGEVDGLKNCDPYSGRNYIALFPGVDVTPGDLLLAVKSQEEFLIVATEHEYVEGQWFQDRAYYGTREEYDASLQDESAQVTTAPEQPDMFNDYLHYLDSLIAIKAPGSKSKFAALLLQVEEFLSTDEITKGSLAEYSQLLEENEWLAAALGTILVSWVSR